MSKKIIESSLLATKFVGMKKKFNLYRLNGWFYFHDLRKKGKILSKEQMRGWCDDLGEASSTKDKLNNQTFKNMIDIQIETYLTSTSDDSFIF